MTIQDLIIGGFNSAEKQFQEAEALLKGEMKYYEEKVDKDLEYMKQNAEIWRGR